MVLIIELPLPVKKLAAFKNDGVPISGNAEWKVFLISPSDNPGASCTRANTVSCTRLRDR